MSRPKRHHFIPVFLQRRFADDNGFLYIFDRRRPELGIRQDVPENTFLGKHLYSTKEPDGRRDETLEHQFGRLEGAAAPIIAKLVDAGRALRPPAIDDSERAIWDLFLAMQWRRVPELHESVVSDAQFETMIAEEVAAFEAHIRPLTTEERALVGTISTSPTLRQNVTVKSLQSGSAMVVSALAKRGLLTAMPERPRKAFILGSRPVLRAGPTGEESLGNDPAVEAWLPIASDVAVTPYGVRGELRHIHLTDKGMRRINLLIAQQSQIIASGSRELLASVIAKLSQD